MGRKPPSAEAGLRQEWSTAEDLVRHGIVRHDGPITHLIKGNLTAVGSQYSTWTWTDAAGNSKSSMHVSGSTYTVAWPGLEGLFAKEIEAGFTISVLSTVNKGSSGTTVGWRWEMKDDNESSWSAISTYRLFKAATSTATEKTASGYAPLATGYNKLPLEVRLRFYSRGNKGKFRVKNSSYIAINRVSKTA